MPADLAVAILGRRALLQVHALHDGVLTVLLLDIDDGLLHTPLLVQGGLLGFPLPLLGLVVGEHGKLLLLDPRLTGFGFVQDAGGSDGHTAHQEAGIQDALAEAVCGGDDAPRGGGVASQVLGAVGVLGDPAAVVIGGDLPLVAGGSCGVGEVLDIVAHGEDDLVGHKALIHQIQGEEIRHLADDQAGLLVGVGVLQHLTRGDAVGLGLVGLDIGNGAGLPAPGMVDEQLGVDTEELIEEGFVMEGGGLSHRAAGDIPHGVEAVGLQGSLVALPHPPEVGEGAVIPQKGAVGVLVKLRDADTVGVGLGVLGHDIHGHLTEVEIGADACRGGDARLPQDVADDAAGEVVGGKAALLQIGSRVDEDLVDGVDVDILGGDVLKVDLIDAGAVLHVVGHAGRGDDVVHGQGGVSHQLVLAVGLTREAAARGSLAALGVDLFDPTDGLKEAGAAGYAVAFEGGGDRQADGLFGAGGVGHQEIGAHGVEASLDAFHRGVEGFQVDGDIGSAFGHSKSLPFGVLASIIPQAEGKCKRF